MTVTLMIDRPAETPTGAGVTSGTPAPVGHDQVEALAALLEAATPAFRPGQSDWESGYRSAMRKATRIIRGQA